MRPDILLLVFVFFLSGSPSKAQLRADRDEEPFLMVTGNGPGIAGAFVSFGLGSTMIDRNNSMLAQVRLAARIQDGLSLGFAGSGFTDCLSGLNYDRPGLSEAGYYIEGGYGGFLLEPVFAPRFPVHLTFPMLIGAGVVAFTGDSGDDSWSDPDTAGGRYVICSDAFLVIEPGVELEFNLARFLRMGAGLSYRFTDGIRVDGRTEHLMNGLSGTISLKCGVF